jgi:hypothetical protein
MQRLYGHSLFNVGCFLGLAESVAASQFPLAGKKITMQVSRLTWRQPQILEVADDFSQLSSIQDQCPGVTDFMKGVAESCGALGLKQSGKEAARMAQTLQQGPVHLLDFARLSSVLKQRLMDELEDILLLQVSSDRAQFYDAAQPFGEGVSTRFPEANDDILGASNCLALDQGTACVMHLSRVVEVGLRAVATELGLPKRNNWGRHLADIESELNNRHKASGSQSKNEQFLSEAAVHIGHIKTAWRNPTMHVDRHYDPDEAMKVFVAIRSFMQHLARGLSAVTNAVP